MRNSFSITCMWLLVMFFASSTLGCGIDREQYDAVVHQRDSLATALDDLRFGAERLLATAKAAMDAGKLQEALDASNDLLKRHPEAPEAVEAKTLAQSAKLKLEAKAEREERERRALVAKQEKAREDSARAERARLDRAIASMYRRRDNVRDITFYYDRTVPYTVNSSSKVLLYIAKPDDGSPTLRFSIRYVADEWLFIESYTFKVDDLTFHISPDGFRDIERDNGYGDIWEWYDTSVGLNERAIVEALINSKHAVIRYVGQQYYHDRTITATEKAALKRTMDAYAVLVSK